MSGLRLTVIAPRYHPSIIGGSELYLRELLEGLAARGVEIEVLTTGSMRVEFAGEHTIRWSDEATECPSSAVTIRRCPVSTLPARLERRLIALLEGSLALTAERMPLPGTYLGGGFFAVFFAAAAWRVRSRDFAL